MLKTYYTQQNIGKAKYCLNYHDGKTEHKDGSPFFDIYIFTNKKKLEAKIKELESEGYVKKH
tara:strand:- start:323 stop:508 length:186 start_codon:yes stop_codon:yes gene_type:complete